MKKINLKLPENLLKMAQGHRKKVFKKNKYDESFSKEEIKLIDKLISLSVEKRDIISEKELNKLL